MRAATLALLLGWPGALAAQGSAETALAVARDLAAAAEAADRAGGPEERIAALTAQVRAYEDGLGLMRDGLRRAAGARAALEADLDADRDRLARLLAALQAVSATPEAATLLHPGGALETARAGMLLAGLAPTLEAEAAALRARLLALADAQALQAEAERVLREGLSGAQAARAALAAAVADRTDLPPRPGADPAAMARLIAATETLDAFAAGLAGLVDAAAPAAAPAEPWDLPLRGVLLRGAGEADAAGVARPGLVLAAAPGALVTAPMAATLRFRGPLLDYGTVAVIEPGPGLLVVLAGLGEAWGAPGDVLAPGAPLGLMPGAPPGGDAILSAAAGAGPALGGAGLTETLYLEVREEGAALDPAGWFVLEGSGNGGAPP